MSRAAPRTARDMAWEGPGPGIVTGPGPSCEGGSR